MLKSKERGLDVSDKLGQGFTGNGDVFGFCYHANDNISAIGLDSGIYDEVNPSAPGATVTSMIDLRNIPEKSFNVREGIIVEDGTSPGITKIPYSIAMAIASKTLGVRKFPPQDRMEKMFEVS